MTAMKLNIKLFYVLAVVLLALLSWRGYLFLRSNWVTEIPTCVQLTFAEKLVAMSEADSIINSGLAELSLNETDTSRKFARYSKTSDVWVRWEYPSHNLESNQSRLHVCQWNRNSDKWKSVALAFESKLTAKYAMTKAQINRNPSVFKCGAQCNVDSAIPLDFTLLDATVLKKP
jgi:hypothetical protein